MEDPKDSLNFEIYGLKASAVGRFTIVAVLTFLLALAAFGWAAGPGQLSTWWAGSDKQISAQN